MNIKVKFVSPEDFEIIEPSTESKTILYKHKPTKLPDCIIPRMGSRTTYFALAVIRLLQHLGVTVLNPGPSILKAKDKLHTVQILADKGLPIPKTMLAKMPLHLDLIKKEFTFPIILKTISGSFGRGVILCKNADQMVDTIDMIRQSNDGNVNVIIQEFISFSKGKDIRVFVIGGRAIGAMLRTARRGKYKANYHAGGKVESFPLNPELEWLACECAKLLNLDVAGVDILFDKGSYKVCEINSNPGFDGFEKATGLNVPREVFQYLQLRSSGMIDKE